MDATSGFDANGRIRLQFLLCVFRGGAHGLVHREGVMRAIHLRTADRGADDAIASWLDGHGVEVIECDDPFDACVVALRYDGPPPRFAFIGLDWISPQEFSIAGRFREIWPEIILVLHGSPQAAAGFPAAPLTFVCRGGETLRNLLSAPPADLLARFKGARRTSTAPSERWRPAPSIADTPPLSDYEPDTLSPSPASDDNGAQRVDTDNPVPDNPPIADPRVADPPRIVDRPRMISNQGPDETPPPRQADALTPEELAMLLEDWQAEKHGGGLAAEG